MHDGRMAVFLHHKVLCRDQSGCLWDRTAQGSDGESSWGGLVRKLCSVLTSKGQLPNFYIETAM